MNKSGFTIVEVMVVMVIIAVMVLTVIEAVKKNTNSQTITTTRNLPGSGYNEDSDGSLELIVTDGSALKVMTVTQKLKAAVTITTGTSDTIIVRW